MTPGPGVLSLVPAAGSQEAAVPLPPPLLTAKDVGRLLNVNAKRVYDLPIARVKISEHAYRWKLDDVLAFIDDRRASA